MLDSEIEARNLSQEVRRLRVKNYRQRLVIDIGGSLLVILCIVLVFLVLQLAEITPHLP